MRFNVKCITNIEYKSNIYIIRSMSKIYSEQILKMKNMENRQFWVSMLFLNGTLVITFVRK